MFHRSLREKSRIREIRDLTMVVSLEERWMENLCHGKNILCEK
jgi:hypothetical protein